MADKAQGPSSEAKNNQKPSNAGQSGTSTARANTLQVVSSKQQDAPQSQAGASQPAKATPSAPPTSGSAKSSSAGTSKTRTKSSSAAAKKASPSKSQKSAASRKVKKPAGSKNRPSRAKTVQTAAKTAPKARSAGSSRPASQSVWNTSQFFGLPSPAFDTKAFENTTQTMESIMNANNTQFDKISQESMSNLKEGSEAVMQTGSTMMKGVEEYLKTLTNICQDAAEKNANSVKSLMKCNTINEFSETQYSIAHQSFDDMMSGITKLSELSLKMCSDCFEPMNTHFTKTIKKTSNLAS